MDLISTAIARTLTPDLAAQLRVPFDWSANEVRPGSVRKDGTGVLALAYANPRVNEERLAQVVEPSRKLNH